MAVHVIHSAEASEEQSYSTLSGSGTGGTFMVGKNDFAGWYNEYGIWGIIYRQRMHSWLD